MIRTVLFTTIMLFSTKAFSQANTHFEGVLNYSVDHGNKAEKTDYPNQLKMYVTANKLRIDAKTYFGYVIYIFDGESKTGVRLYEIYGDKYLVKIDFEKEGYQPDAIVEVDKKEEKMIKEKRCGLATISQPGITYIGWYGKDLHISNNIQKLAPFVPYGIIQPHKKIGNRLFFSLTIQHQAESDKQFQLEELITTTPNKEMFQYREKDFEPVSAQKIQETINSLSDWKQY